MTLQQNMGPIPDLQTIRDMGWANTIWIVGVLLLVLIIKVIIQKELVGIAAYGPTDRGYRERRGNPGKYLTTGLHWYLVGLGKQRRTTIAKLSISTKAEARTQQGLVYIVEASLLTQVLDTKEDVYSAIYRTADEQRGQGDTHNAERLQAIEEACGQALLKIIQETESGDPVVTLEKMLACLIEAPRRDMDLMESGCIHETITVQEYIKAICGSDVRYVMARVIRPVDAQLHKDGLMRRLDSEPVEALSQPGLTAVGS